VAEFYVFHGEFIEGIDCIMYWYLDCVDTYVNLFALLSSIYVLHFLRYVAITCISYGNSVCLSVRSSVCLSRPSIV